MAQAKKNAAQRVIVVKAKKGRTIDPVTVAAKATLSKRWGNKSDRETFTLQDETGKDIGSVTGMVVTRSDIGKPETWTGMPGLIGKWKNEAGLNVTVKDQGEFFLIVEK